MNLVTFSQNVVPLQGFTELAERGNETPIGGNTILTNFRLNCACSEFNCSFKHSQRGYKSV